MAGAATEILQQKFHHRTPEGIHGVYETTLPVDNLYWIGEGLTPEPRAVDVRSLPGDRETIIRVQSNLRSRKVGDIALNSTVECKQKPIRNIKEALAWAEVGDEHGLKMLDANILKEASEYMYKIGLSEVALDEDAQGRILQNGQLMEDVYRNGWQLASEHPVIAKRSSAEANNGARLEDYNRQGMLDTHVFVVVSMAAEGLSNEEMEKLNFFTETMSLSIQATTQTDSGLKTETAFVAGVKNPNEARVDRKVVEAIYEYFGVDIRGKAAEEIIDTPLLIPKEYMPNGVVDFVRLYDDINGGTFFGQHKPRQDYLEYKKFCREREARFANDVVLVRKQLIDENHRLENAVLVSKRLAKLVEEKLVKRAITDEKVDVSVFGKVSAGNIVAARMHVRAGEYEQAAIHAQTAIRTATGGSCPSSLANLAKLMGFKIPGVSDDEERKRKSWHGYDDESQAKEGTCKNCDTKKVKVGVAGWCEDCITC